MPWTPNNIPDQSGRVALITGANSGIGLYAARGLADKGAHVILACRNKSKADKAIRWLHQRVPKASLEFLELDLSRQQAVHQAADELRRRHSQLDWLINNAGVMWLERSLTEDKLETQLATNHFGHFTLTARLLDLLLPLPGSRVVTVSSLAHRRGRIYFSDLNLSGSYTRHKAYAQSKVANLIFAIELQRRLENAGAKTISLACHPGISNTNLINPGLIRQSPLRVGALAKLAMPFFSQSPRSGALPTLMAATGNKVEPGGYYGPSWLSEFLGPPGPAYASRYARNPEIAERLWALSLEITGAHCEALPTWSEVTEATGE